VSATPPHRATDSATKAKIAGDATSVLALVWADGTVESGRGSSGAALLRSTPALLRLIHAVLTADVGGIGFVWTPPRGRAIHVRALVGDDGGRCASVTMSTLDVLPYQLTMRELDVLTLLVGGLSNVEIATRLNTRLRTITTHVDRVLRKLGSASRTAAATLAVSEGLVLLPIPGGPQGFERLSHGRVSAAATGKPLSVVAPRQLVLKAPLILGTALPLTGKGSDDGLEMLRGSELALGEINRHGGINGRTVELAIIDIDVNDPASIQSCFEALADREVDSIASGYLGRQDVAHKLAADFGRPYLHAATLHSMVQKVVDDPVRFGHVFQIDPSDVLYAPGFVRTMTALRGRHAWQPINKDLLVLQGSWPMGDLGLEAATTQAERNGWQLRRLQPVGVADENWAAAAKAVRANPPAAVLIGHYFVDGTVAFLRELMANPPPTLIYTLYAPSVPSFRDVLGPLSEGILWATVSGTYSDEVGRGFASRYRSAYGVIPGRSHAGIAYDRTNLIADAWMRSGNQVRHASVVSEQLRTLVHRGVNGAYHLSSPGQANLAYPDLTRDASLGQAHLVFQIQDRRHRILSPAPYANAEFRLPPWLLKAAAPRS
jgi:branched-chain amino acid transport system substrate-binding protein